MAQEQDERISAPIKESAEALCIRLMRYPPAVYSGEHWVTEFDWDHEYKPSDEHLKAARNSSAFYCIAELVELAESQRGWRAARDMTEIALNFFESSGMILRSRMKTLIAGMPMEQRGKKLASVPRIFPSDIRLWVTPKLNFTDRCDGFDSMEGCDREELRLCAVSFYRTGVRCAWFEKMIVEALICAEVYATIKHAKTTPSVWTGRYSFIQSMYVMWAFGKSRGGDPLYSILVYLGRAGIGLVGLVIYGYFLWRSYGAYDNDAGLLNLLWFVVMAGSGVAWVCRFLIRWISRAARPNQNPVFALFQESPFGRALIELTRAHAAVVVSEMSTSVARQAVITAVAADAGIDHIVVSYLDRALGAEEYLWDKTMLLAAPKYFDSCF